MNSAIFPQPTERKTQKGKNNLSVYYDFLTIPRDPLRLIPAGVFPLG